MSPTKWLDSLKKYLNSLKLRLHLLLTGANNWFSLPWPGVSCQILTASTSQIIIKTRHLVKVKKKKTQSNSEVSMNTTSSNISAKSRCLYLKNKMFGVEQELIKELIRTLLLCRMFIFEIQATFNRRIGYQISRDNLVLSTWQSLLSILALFLYMMSSR